jgi:hypothetical protein
MRRRLNAQERLERDRLQAQQAAKALEQALHDLGLPTDLMVEIEARLRRQTTAEQDRWDDVSSPVLLSHQL